MEIVQKLPADLQEYVIQFMPLERHPLHFYLLPMVFYNTNTCAYVCFDVDKTDRNVWKLYKNFCRLRKDLTLTKRDWELVYTPWYRNHEHDKAIVFTFGCLPRSCMHQLLIDHLRRNQVKLGLCGAVLAACWFQLT